MFSAYQNATRTYRDVGLETRAATADPVNLILMLYDGAIDALTQAQAHFTSGDRTARQAAITRAVRIVDEGLSAALDAGAGDLTHQLRELYSYMTRRILTASLTSDAAPLSEVQGLLRDLRSAWQELAQRPELGSSTLAPPAMPAAIHGPAVRAATRSGVRA